jgi:hypothetical protein
VPDFEMKLSADLGSEYPSAVCNKLGQPAALNLNLDHRTRQGLAPRIGNMSG